VGNLTIYTSTECAVCNYNEILRVYRNQLILDLENKVHSNGEWVKNYDNKGIPNRLYRTIVAIYDRFDNVVANDIIKQALRYYWYKSVFTLVQSHQSRGPSR